MSSFEITRRARSFPVTIATATEASTPVPFSDYAGGAVLFKNPPSSAATAVQVWGSSDALNFRRLEAGTITLARLQGQECVTVTASDGTVTSSSQVCTTFFSAVSGVYTLPDPTYPVSVIKLVSDVPLGSVDAVVVVKS